MRVLILILAALPVWGQLAAITSGGTAPATPVDSNSGGGCTGSSGAWTCTGAATVTLTDATAPLIFYTTNGSTPTPSSTLYVTPFTSPGTTFTLKAVGCALDGNCGAILTSVYTISGASLAHVASSNVQHASTGTSTTFDITLNSQPTSSQGVIVFITPAAATTPTSYTITGAGCTFTRSIFSTNGVATRYLEIWKGISCSGSGGTTVTTTYSSTSTIIRGEAFLVDNLAADDVSTGTVSLSSNSILTGSVTPTVSTGLCASASYRSGGSGNGSVGGSWTLGLGPGGSLATPTAWIVPGSTAAEQATFTFSTAPDSGSVAVIACYK